ncbi:MAG TPA: gamma-glutamylcyclotransferase [Candidatus Polarisedimenticolaceae bacterium]|nr:gamma-glutamylcyclotransferase [Candidatus Polarisedimenticolaceae bacterium]
MLYFAYGSNLDAGDLARFGIALAPIARAYLPDRRLAFTHDSSSRGGGVLDAVEATGCAVEGVLFRLEDRAARLLDDKESRGHRYRRVASVALTDDGAEHAAFFYEVAPAHREAFVPPAGAYLDVVRRGAHAHGLDGAPLEAAAAGDAHAGPVRHLFVYGTLMAGEERSHHLAALGMTDCVPARIAGSLLDLGAYPGLRVDGAGGTVEGELYSIPDPRRLFEVLDPIETFRGFGAAGSLYRRAIVLARLGGGSAPAWSYVYAGPHDRGKIIPSGSWRGRAVG